MDKFIKVRATARFRVRERVVEAGEELDLSAEDAVAVVGGGRAVPIKESEYRAAVDALNHAAIRACANGSRPGATSSAWIQRWPLLH
jgi:hypothetical protein